jgi:hypothetical protein
VKALAELGIAFAELLEAEGRKLREKSFRWVVAVAVVVVAAIALLGGLGFLVTSVFLALTGPFGAPVAALVTAFACFFLAAGGFLWAKTRVR